MQTSSIPASLLLEISACGGAIRRQRIFSSTGIKIRFNFLQQPRDSRWSLITPSVSYSRVPLLLSAMQPPLPAVPFSRQADIRLHDWHSGFRIEVSSLV